jgi:hypothetical protein
VYIKLVVLLRNYVTMMHGQQNIKNGWATIVVVGRLRVKYVVLKKTENKSVQRSTYMNLHKSDQEILHESEQESWIRLRI